MITLTCQIETAQVLLGPPCGFLFRMIFLICGPSEFYLDCGFSKVPGDVLIIVVQLTPVGFIQPVVFKK